MSFLSAGMLSLLGLAAVVIILYFFKRQARPASVSALFLWHGLEWRPRSARRLRWTQLLALFLQLFALTALVVGLAQPVASVPASGVSTLALLLDGSASMRAPAWDGGPTRYRRAVEQALEVLRENPAAETAVIRAQARSALFAPATRDHPAIERLLRRSGPGFRGDAEPDELIRLVESQFPAGADRVVFLTDRPPPFDAALLGWEVLRVGEEIPNVALVHLSAREQPDGRGVALLLEAWNSGDDPLRVPLRITADGRPLEARELPLPPGSSQFSFEREGAPASRYVGRLLTEGLADGWAADDVRYAALPTPRPWEVLWVGEENFYLERFLRRSERAEVTRRPGWETFDLALVNGAEVGEPLPGSYLLLGTTLAPWVTTGEEIEAPTAVQVKVDHPVLAGIDPTEWRLLRVPRVRVDPRGEVLLAVGDIPLLYLYRGAGMHLAYLGVDLSASNLGLSLDFPILMHHLLTWLAPPVEVATDLWAGSELPLLARGARVTGPDGRTCEVTAGEACGLAERPGFYQVEQDGVARVYAVNLPPGESRPGFESSRSTLSGSSTPPALASQALRAAWPLWPYLLAIATALMALELLLFDRSLAPWSGGPHSSERTLPSRIRARLRRLSGGRR